MRKAVGSHKWAHRGCMKQLEKDGRLCRDKQCRIWSGVVYAVYREELPKWNAPKNTSGFYNIMSLEFTLKKVPQHAHSGSPASEISSGVNSETLHLDMTPNLRYARLCCASLSRTKSRANYNKVDCLHIGSNASDYFKLCFRFWFWVTK